MKLFKKIPNSIVAISLALILSSYTSAPKEAFGDYFVTLDGWNYSYISASSFDESNCLSEGDMTCYFRLTILGSLFIGRNDVFTAEQARGYIGTPTPLLFSEGNAKGIYLP